MQTIFWLWFICIVIVLIAVTVKVWLWAYKMANIPLGKDSNFFVICPPGKFLGIMLGEKFWKWISNVNGFEIQSRQGVFAYSEEINGSHEITLDTNGHLPPEFFDLLKKQNPTPTLMSRFGIHWAWFKPLSRVYSKDSDWLQWEQNVVSEKKTDDKPDEHRLAQNVKQMSDTFYDFKFMMNVLMVAKDSEAGEATQAAMAEEKSTNERAAETIQLDLYSVFTVVLLCPYKALITGNWLKILQAEWTEVCTEYTKAHTVDEIFMRKDFDKEVVAKLFKRNVGLLKMFGFVVTKIQYQGAEFSHITPGLRAASEQVWISTKKATEIRNLKGAEADGIRAIGKAKGDANREELAGLGDSPFAAALLQARAIEGHTGTLVLGSGGMLPTFSVDQTATPPKQAKKVEVPPPAETKA